MATTLDALSEAGIAEVLTVELTKAALGIPVLRVVVPGLETAFESPEADYVPGARAMRVLQAEAGALGVMTRCVFLGPSLPLEQARDLCGATYLPPAKQGDIARALRTYEPEAIGLIDGFFEQVPAVWHKEILWALQERVAVLGASSMGALRAAELQQFGMVGIGKIFRAYSSGSFPPFDDLRFEDDDEVAVVHGPPELNYVGSVALVDIRATLARSEQEGGDRSGLPRFSGRSCQRPVL